MPATYGFFVFHDQYPHYIYLKDDFVIGTAPESDWVLPVSGLAEGRGGAICRVVFRQSRSGRIMAHLVVDRDYTVQLRSAFLKTGREYQLKEGDVVKVPSKVEGNTVIRWLILTYGEILPGSVFSRYHFIRVLGVGGFGIVYEGRNVVTGGLHAVKAVRKMRCLQSGTSNDPVRKEVDILKALNHPYIVTLDDAFQDARSLFLVMELARKGSLHDLIIRKTRLNESDAKLVTLDVTSALTYLHAMGIVHRDIKPENILIQSHNPLSTKVSDFGLAKIVQGGTDLRTFCGTPDFMAPEMGPLEGYDNKVDTWALGVTLFVMLSGQTPFSTQGNRPRIEWQRLPPVTSKLGTQLMCRMLTINPSQRPAASDIAGHPWFVLLAAEQPQALQAAHTVSAAPAAHTVQMAQAPSSLSAQGVTMKRVLIVLVIVGLAIGCSTWVDAVCRIVAIIAVAQFI